MKYKSAIVKKLGGPEVIEIIESDLHLPAANEVRIKILAASVSRPDISVLTVIGGYTDVLYWRADRLIPVPADVDTAEAVTRILNYIVAYQVMRRVLKAKPAEKALIIGASGGIGTALLQNDCQIHRKEGRQAGCAGRRLLRYRRTGAAHRWRTRTRCGLGRQIEGWLI